MCIAVKKLKSTRYWYALWKRGLTDMRKSFGSGQSAQSAQADLGRNFLPLAIFFLTFHDSSRGWILWIHGSYGSTSQLYNDLRRCIMTPFAGGGLINILGFYVCFMVVKKLSTNE